MASIIDTIYLHREKEENWELEEQAELLGWGNSRDMVYIGSEIAMKVEITNNNAINTKVLELNGVDVSDKEIYI